MKLKIKKMRFLTGRPVSILNESDLKENDIHIGQRILIKINKT